MSQKTELFTVTAPRISNPPQFWEEFTNLLSFDCFNPYGDVSKNYDLITAHYSDLLVKANSTSAEHYYVQFTRYKLKFSHHRHVYGS
jgi:hypothetical protein